MGLSIRGIVRKIKENQDFKTLVANFGYLSLLKIASFIFPFITLPYLAKTIGADGFGKIAFAAAVIAWFQTVADWGFNYTATRDVAKNRDNKDVVSDIFSRVFFSRCLLMLASFVVLFL
ncbi:MAG: oligosaccharide flippase family protein, partial [Bacteroidales bacterium]|nr:oligosaccharide flippase family protein [Bacteroidales bacterium]